MNFEHQSGSSMAQQSVLRFCWLRETAPGHLEHDGDIRIAKCDLLLALFGMHPAQKRTTAEPAVTLEEVLAILSAGAPFDNFPVWARRRLANILGPLASEKQRRTAARNAGVLMDVANRILAVVPADDEVEVHLPYIDRRDWPTRFEILESTEFVLCEGRVIPTTLLSSSRLDEYNAQLLAISSASPQISKSHIYAHSHGLITLGQTPPPGRPEPRHRRSQWHRSQV